MHYSRRNVLKGLTLGAGAHLLSPIVSQLRANSVDGTSLLPKRFVFVSVSSGIMPEEVAPPALKGRSADDYINVPLADQKLEASMQPFEGLKDYLSIIQGLSGKMCAGGHTSNYGAFGAWRSAGEGWAPSPKRATVDSILSKMHPGAINHLTTALTGHLFSRTYENVVYPFISAAGPGKTIPFQASPDIVFEQLFGTVASNNQSSAQRLRSKKDLLHFLSDDVKKIQNALPSQEKAKLEYYLDALENLQGQDVKIAALRESLEKHAPEFTDKYTTKETERRQEAHFDLIAAGLIAGVTNVCTMKIDNSMASYPGLGLVGGTVHNFGHNEGVNGKSGRECRNIIRRHHFDIIAHLAKKLKAVPEGEGNMLDNTMIIYMSPAGNKHHGTLETWPMVVVGGCAKRLKLPGRYIQFPGYGQIGHKTIGNWWTSVLNAYGNPIKHYGDMDAVLMKEAFKQEGPIPEIIA